MKIRRIGANKDIDICPIDRLEISIGEDEYVLTDESGGLLRIHKTNGDRITIYPCVRNEIVIK